MNQLDEKTSIPLSWGIIALVSVITGVATGSFWVKGVNDRLLRIEQKLKIEPMTHYGVIEAASADQTSHEGKK